MLSEWFFDILTHASGLVAGKDRQALARYNLLPGKGLLTLCPRDTCPRGCLISGCSHLALAKPVLCGQDEGTHSALN
jgi:hypothetical protein